MRRGKSLSLICHGQRAADRGGVVWGGEADATWGKGSIDPRSEGLLATSCGETAPRAPWSAPLSAPPSRAGPPPTASPPWRRLTPPLPHATRRGPASRGAQRRRAEGDPGAAPWRQVAQGPALARGRGAVGGGDRVRWRRIWPVEPTSRSAPAPVRLRAAPRANGGVLLPFRPRVWTPRCAVRGPQVRPPLRPLAPPATRPHRAASCEKGCQSAPLEPTASAGAPPLRRAGRGVSCAGGGRRSGAAV